MVCLRKMAQSLPSCASFLLHVVQAVTISPRATCGQSLNHRHHGKFFHIFNFLLSSKLALLQQREQTWNWRKQWILLYTTILTHNEMAFPLSCGSLKCHLSEFEGAAGPWHSCLQTSQALPLTSQLHVCKQFLSRNRNDADCSRPYDQLPSLLLSRFHPLLEHKLHSGA